MKNGLLERIQSVGHWRVLLRPLTPLPERLSFKDCSEIVERARVSIRGWDYPHMSNREDDQSGTGRGEDYLEGWCDWNTQVEFWRMYRSGQFLSYNSLDEDLVENAEADRRSLDVVGAIYAVTEFVEFAHRLAASGLYASGYSADLSLRNTRGRFLKAGRGRVPFSYYRRTDAETIQIGRTVEPDANSLGAIETSLSVLLELFDAFGWNPQPSQIRADQESFYRHEFR